MCVQPAFIIGTYDENGNANFAPITWVSITWDTDRYLLVISMNGSKKTKQNADINKKLSANLVNTWARLVTLFNQPQEKILEILFAVR